MGYLFLTIALLSGATKGFCGKKISGYTENTQSSVVLNLIRMLLCTLLSFLLIIAMGDVSYCTPNYKSIILSAISGISTSFFVVTWLLSVRKSAYMMIDVFLMLGTLVPVVSGYFIFNEPITLRQAFGFLLLLFAVIIMCSYNNSIKAKHTLSSILFLIACGASNGITSASQKAFVKSFPEIPVSIFNLYTYIFAAITLAVFLAIRIRNEKPRFSNGSSKITYVYIFIMAIALTANSYFNTMASIYLDSAKLYPLQQGAALIISTVMATIFFKEKLKIKAVIGVVLAFAALMIINL